MPSLAIRYGTGSTWIDVPSRRILGILTYRPTAPPPRNPLPVLEQALEATADGPAFAEWVQPGKRTCVVVPDRSVYAATADYVPLLLDRLARAGVPPERTDILVACGLRPPASEDALDALLGPGVRGRVRVTQSDARDAAAFADLGRTPRGLPVRLHRLLVETEQVVLTGLVSLDPWFGFTGGAPALASGCSSPATLRLLRVGILDPSGAGDPLLAAGVGSGRREGNPVHEEARAAAGLLRKPVFLYNTIATPDDRLLDVASGAPGPAFDEACRVVAEHFGPPYEHQALLAVASAGGFPRDIDFAQALHAIEFAAPLVEEGGVLVLHAECREGWGVAGISGESGAADSAVPAEALADRFSVSGLLALRARAWAKRRRIVLVSSLPADEVRRAGMTPAATPEAAVDLYSKWLPDNPPTYILPEAGLVAPTPATAV